MSTVFFLFIIPILDLCQKHSNIPLSWFQCEQFVIQLAEKCGIKYCDWLERKQWNEWRRCGETSLRRPVWPGGKACIRSGDHHVERNVIGDLNLSHRRGARPPALCLLRAVIRELRQLPPSNNRGKRSTPIRRNTTCHSNETNQKKCQRQPPANTNSWWFIFYGKWKRHKHVEPETKISTACVFDG